MKSLARVCALSLAVLTSAALGGSRIAHASLIFCRTDPAVSFTTLDGSTRRIYFSASVALPRSDVTEIDWVVTLPAGSGFVHLSKGGPVPEVISVDSTGPGDSVTASATALSSKSAEVDVSASAERHDLSASPSVGLTNQPVSVSLAL